jgi:thiamine-phosphate pyrophosphorylase
MLRYAITSRILFPGDDRERQQRLLSQAARWAVEGVDLIQLREKDLPARSLIALARAMLQKIQETGSSAKLLVNSRADVAVVVRAHGVHLTASPGELSPAQVRELYASAGLPAPVITLSCHTLTEVEACVEAKAEREIERSRGEVDAILFAPVFHKQVEGVEVVGGLGLDQLKRACVAAAPVPVYALGGVTFENAGECLRAGAAGIAGIRLFHDTAPGRIDTFFRR